MGRIAKIAALHAEWDTMREATTRVERTLEPLLPLPPPQVPFDRIQPGSRSVSVLRRVEGYAPAYRSSLTTCV